MKPAKIFVISLVFFGMLISSNNVWSAFEIHPRLTLGGEYNDNIYLDNTDQNEEDWITTVEPGFNLTYDSRSLEAAIDYSARFRFYNNHSSNDQDSLKKASRGNGTLSFFSGRPFTLLISETVTNEARDERRNNADYNDSQNRTIHYQTSVNPQYRWQLTRTFSLVFGYTYARSDYVDSGGNNNRSNYDNSGGNDTVDHIGQFSLVKQVSSTTEVFARFTYTDHHSEGNFVDYGQPNPPDEDLDDYDKQDYTLGITQQVSSRISVSLEGGYSYVDFDSGSHTDNPHWLGNITYRLSEPVTFTLDYSRSFEDSTDDGLIDRRDASFGATYVRESLTVSPELFWYKSNYEVEDREDKGYGVRFNLSKSLSRVLTFDFNAAYERDKYTAPDEKVHLYTVGGSLNYSYHRFLISLGYIYRDSDSDLDDNDYYDDDYSDDYTNNVVTLTGTMQF